MNSKLIKFALCMLLSTPSFAQLPSYLPPDGLVAWFPFTGNAIDSTGNGHDGTPHSTTNSVGRYGVPNTAFSFNGTSSFIYIPAGTLNKEQSVDITASLTISAWVKSKNYSYSSQEQIYWRGDAASAHDPHMLYFHGGQVRLRRDVDPGTISNEVGYSTSGLDSNYHMLTGTYDSATSVMRIYIDGVKRNEAVLPGFQTYPTSTMYNYIGAVDGGTWQFFYGDIDELGIWRRALTPCEVKRLYYSASNTITEQPVDSTVTAGTAVTFSVSASVATPTYQWQENSGSGFVDLSNTTTYSGVNTATLSINPVTASMTGYNYRCVIVSDTCYNHVSDSARLTVSVDTTGGGTHGVAAQSLVKNNLDIEVIPNPNDAVFIVTGQGDFPANLQLLITDVMGREVYTTTLVAGKGKINAHIELPQQVGNGIYLVKIYSATDHLNKVIKMIVQR